MDRYVQHVKIILNSHEVRARIWSSTIKRNTQRNKEQDIIQKVRRTLLANSPIFSSDFHLQSAAISIVSTTTTFSIYTLYLFSKGTYNTHGQNIQLRRARGL